MGHDKYYEKDRLIENIRAPFPLEFGDRTPLSVSHPEIAIEFHRSRNDGYGPEDFSYASSLIVWWRCSVNKKHEWQAEICNRTLGRCGCPECYAESWGIDLADYPQVLKFFDKEKNQGISPNKIPVGGSIYWHCSEGKKHDWYTRFNTKVIDTFCPFCRGRKASPQYNLSLDPILGKQFHPTRNGTRKAKDLVPTSKLPIWWKCPEGPDHEFQMRPSERTIKGYGCPFCSRRRFSQTSSLLAEFPQIARQWHKDKNGDLKPSQISSRAKKSVWWQCPRAEDHEWKATVANRTYHGNGCPYCANRSLSCVNNLAALYPDLAKEFDKEKNYPLTAKDVVFSTTAEVWWKCANKHSWQRAVYLRTQRGSRCPDCPDYKQRQVKTSLKEAFPKIAKHWHPKKNGEQSPENTSFGSKAMAWWQCKEGPDHEWQQGVGHMTRHGYKCPFCEGTRLSVTNSLKALFPELAKEWHKKRNVIKSHEVMPGSSFKPWWQCSVCAHEWERECYLRANRKSACPRCKFHPE